MIALYDFENTITTGYNNDTKRIKKQNKLEQCTIALTKCIKKSTTLASTHKQIHLKNKQEHQEDLFKQNLKHKIHKTGDGRAYLVAVLFL